jgi:hypothetical protein
VGEIISNEILKILTILLENIASGIFTKNASEDIFNCKASMFVEDSKFTWKLEECSKAENDLLQFRNISHNNTKDYLTS